MKRTVQIQAKHYFGLVKQEQQKLFPHLFAKETTPDESSLKNTQSSIDYESPH